MIVIIVTLVYDVIVVKIVSHVIAVSFAIPLRNVVVALSTLVNLSTM